MLSRGKQNKFKCIGFLNLRENNIGAITIIWNDMGFGDFRCVGGL